MIHKRILAAAAACLVAVAAHAQTRTLGLTMIVEHPVLESVRTGVLDELKSQGFEEGKNLKVNYRNAQGNSAVAAQIARQFAGAELDVVVAITTPSAQAMVSASSRIPIVFSAITDPVGAKLVAAHGAGGKNVTGLSDYPPVPQQLAMVQELLPAAKRIGVVYSPGESNSVAQVNMLKAEAAKVGFSVVEAAATRSADVQTAARSLVGKVDVLYVPADNAVMSALDGLLGVTMPARLPVIAPDDAGVEKGALAAIGHDYYRIGRESGVLAARILRGEPAGQIPWQVGTHTELVINRATAQALAVKVPDSLAKRAKLVGRQ